MEGAAARARATVLRTPFRALTAPPSRPRSPRAAPQLREFEDLKAAVAGLWEQLDVPAEEVTAFLSEADLMAPYSPQVLEMYQDLYTRLSQNMPLPDAQAAYAPSPAAPSYGSSYNYSPAVQQVDAPTPGPGFSRSNLGASGASLAASKNLPPSLGGPGARRR